MPSKKFEPLLKSILSSNFEPVFVKYLMNKYMRMAGIRDFTSLTEKQKIDFAETMIKSIFGRVKTDDQLALIRLNFFLNYSQSDIEEKVAAMLGSRVSIQLPSFRVFTEKTLMESLEMMSKEAVFVKVAIKGYVEGSMYIVLFKDHAIKLANLMLVKMMGQDPSNSLDEMTVSAVNEFMNIFVSSYVDVISNILETEIFFTVQPNESTDTMTFINDVKTLFFLSSQDEAAKIKKIYTGDLNLSMWASKVEGYFIILLNKMPGEMDSYLSHKKLEKVSFDLEEEKIKQKEEVEKQVESPKRKKRKKNYRIELTLFLGKFFDNNESKSIIDEALEEVGLTDLIDTETALRRELVQSILDIAFADISTYKLGMLKSGLYDALDLHTTQASADKKKPPVEEKPKDEKKPEKKESDSVFSKFIKQE